MRDLTKVLMAAAAGAGAMYLFDPAGGRARRTRMKDQAESAARDAVDTTNTTLDLARDRAMGAVAEALPDKKPENDETLVAKVRSEALGPRWRNINADASEGVVTLRGELGDPDEISDLEDAVSSVTGVEEVVNLVHLPGETPKNVRDARRTSTTRR